MQNFVKFTCKIFALVLQCIYKGTARSELSIITKDDDIYNLVTTGKSRLTIKEKEIFDLAPRMAEDTEDLDTLITCPFRFKRKTRDVFSVSLSRRRELELKISRNENSSNTVELLKINSY